MEDRGEVRFLLVLDFQAQCSFQMDQVLPHEVAGLLRITLRQGIYDRLVLCDRAAWHQPAAIDADDEGQSALLLRSLLSSKTGKV